MSKIAVVGDSCIDVYLYGNCERMCPEGPVPVLRELERSRTLGMAGNTYNNMRAFYSDVDFMSNNPKEITKTRYVDKKTNQLLLRVDREQKCDRISMGTIDDIIMEKYDLVVVSDYCKGFLSDKDLTEIGACSQLSIIDTKRKLTPDIIDSYDFIKLNKQEYQNNIDVVDKSKTVITMGSRGARFMDITFKTPKVLETFDVSGAGDVFTASFAHMILKGESAESSIEFAQDCCCQVIQKRGTCVYENNMD
jgi:bifunctional ADP-heptose synthase (sugar kinase/adenylyltransferase)